MSDVREGLEGGEPQEEKQRGKKSSSRFGEQTAITSLAGMWIVWNLYITDRKIKLKIQVRVRSQRTFSVSVKVVTGTLMKGFELTIIFLELSLRTLSLAAPCKINWMKRNWKSKQTLEQPSNYYSHHGMHCKRKYCQRMWSNWNLCILLLVV